MNHPNTPATLLLRAQEAERERDCVAICLIAQEALGVLELGDPILTDILWCQDRMLRSAGIDPATLMKNGAQQVSSETQVLHAALDYRLELALFGFSRAVRDSNGAPTKKSEAIHLVSGSPDFEVGSTRFVLDTRFDNPPELEYQWPERDFEDFIAQPAAPSGRQLYEQLAAALRRHCDFVDEGAYPVLAAWVLLTYCFPAFPAVPFILFIGPKETGKSVALDVLDSLCRCGHRSSATAAALGDLIQSQRITWLIDQADVLGHQLLNDLVASYQYNARRTVVDEKNRGKPHTFSMFAPKAFAVHEGFGHDLLDRCIQIPTAPAARSMEPLLAHDSGLRELRTQLYRFALANHQRLFMLDAFRNRKSVGQTLGFDQRCLELWWPIECMMEWLDVPDADCEAARTLYRRSIRSSRAELPADQRAVLMALPLMGDSDSDSLTVFSNDFKRDVGRHCHWDEQPDEAHVGRLLGRMGLLVDKDRKPHPKTKLKTTRWTIDLVRAREQARRWRVDLDG